MVKRLILLLIILLVFNYGLADILLSGNLEEQRLEPAGVISKILPEFAEYALLIGADGTAVLISANSFPLLKVDKNADDKYNCSAPNLPPVCSIKNLAEICVYRSFYGKDPAFTTRMKNFKLLGTTQKQGHFARKYKLKN